LSACLSSRFSDSAPLSIISSLLSTPLIPYLLDSTPLSPRLPNNVPLSSISSFSSVSLSPHIPNNTPLSPISFIQCYDTIFF
jgi:hypothetical protein